MTYTPKIVAFSGSTRVDSFNKKLVKIAAKGAEAAGAAVTYVDLRDLPMPLYDGDLEVQAGIPSNAQKFKELLISHDGMLIATPEYNGFFSGALKNAIDWATRPAEGEAFLAAFSGKVAAIMSTSPGAIGGLRGLPYLRILLSGIRVLVIPEQVAVGKYMEAFKPDGSLADPQQQAAVEQLGANVANTIKKLKG